jgi:hypothetical protein
VHIDDPHRYWMYLTSKMAMYIWQKTMQLLDTCKAIWRKTRMHRTLIISHKMVQA